MVVGTADGIVMIESGAKEVKEETVVDAIEFAHTEIKKICAAINELREKGGKPKRAVTPPEFDQAYYDELKNEIGADLTDRLDTEKTSQSGKPQPGQRTQEGTAGRDSRGRRSAPERSSRPTTRLCGSAFSASTLSTRSAVPTAAPSIRSATSGSKSAFCPEPTDPPSSPAAKPRPWSPPLSAPATTCSASKSSKAKPRSASCCTITFRRFRLEKWHFCEARDGAKSDTARWPSGRFPQFCRAKKSGLMRCAWSPTFWSRMDRRRWQRSAARRFR